MARTGWGAADFLRGAAPITALPLTIAAWARVPTLGTAQYIAGLFASGAAASGLHQFALLVNSSNRVRAYVANNGSDGANTSTSFAAATWFHACAVFANASQAVFLNGGGKGTQVSTRTPSGIDRASVGIGDSGGTPATPLLAGADAAEVAIWNIALTDAEVALLATGMWPPLLHPESIVGYWPLLGELAAEANLINEATVLNVQGTLSASDHPPIIRPRRRSAA